MKLQRSNIVTVLDIGSAKTICLIAKLNLEGAPQIIGVGESATRGIKAGIVTDIRAACYSVMRAIEFAKQSYNGKIGRIYIGIPSSVLLSHRVSSRISVIGHEINYKDLNKLSLEILSNYHKQPLEVIHSFACDYVLDGNHGISNPLGMYGDNLACKMHVLAIPSNLLLNISNVVNGAGIEIENYISSSYANGLACLSKDEIEIGVTLIDMGAGHTSISLFEDGNMIFSEAIALGGMNITNDIARGLCTTILNAERIKNLYGAAVVNSIDKNDTIEVQTSDIENCEINIVERSFLVEIIQARLDEIMSLLKAKLDENDLTAINKIVIVGNGAKLPRIQEMVSEVFDLKVRIGIPKLPKGLNDDQNGLNYSTSIGMLIHVMEYMQKEAIQNRHNGDSNIGYLQHLIRKVVDIF